MKKWSAGSRTRADGRGSGIVTVFALLFLFVLVFLVTLLNRLEFQRIGGNDLEVGATLGAGDDLALVHLFLFDVQVGVAFWTENHKPSLAY